MHRLAIAAVVVAVLAPSVSANTKESARANYDIREDAGRANVIEGYRAKAGDERAARIREKKEKIHGAAARVKGEVPGLDVAFSEQTGGPEIVGVGRGRQKLTGKSKEPRENVARGFLQRNADLYGLSPREVAQLRKTADYANPAGNLAWVEFKQELNGLPLFQGEVRFAVTAEGELVESTGNLVPALDDAPAEKEISVDAAAAVVVAAQSIGVELSPRLKQADGTTQLFDRGPFTHDVKVQLEYFPLDSGIVTLAWSMILWQEDAAFYTYVSAEGGELLWRKNIAYQQSQPATYVVYDAESPAPLSPTNATPGSGIQAPLIPRKSFTIVSEHALDSLGWMTDGTSITTGNNVDAGLDLTAPDGIDAGTRATGTAFRVFDYAYNPPPGNPPPGDAPSLANARFGEVVQMFFWANRYHDRLYDLGFTEAARNFQQDNFGRGGLGNDPILAEGQDYVAVNNAVFFAPPDGISGTMELFLFTGADPDRSSGLDQEVSVHELTHGTSDRLHANGSGLGGVMAGGMAEGWSDFYARALTSGPDEDVNGVYAPGAWTTPGYAPGYTDNYYYGIRRFPYAVIASVGPNGRPHNPLTFADIDPAQADLSDGAYPRGPNGSTNPLEPHAIGEIWCSALLEVRARLITRFGWAAGNQLALQLVTDGMKLDPLSPTMLQARNSILAANFGSAGASPAVEVDIWRGFAARGMGFSSRVVTANTGSVVEAFDIPNVTIGAVTVVSDDCDHNGVADPGETVVLSIPFTNPYQLNDINDAVVTVGATTVALGPLAPGQSVTRTFTVTIPSSASCGTIYDVPLSVATSFGTVARVHPLQIGIRTAQVFAGSFSSGNVDAPILDNQTIEVPIEVAASGSISATRVSLRLNHPFDSELAISLVAPDGTIVPLATRRGGSGDNFGTGPNDCSGEPTLFADFTSSPPIASGVAPFIGAFRPESPLSAVTGHEMHGTWKLRVTDLDAGDTGAVGCAKLDLSRQLAFCCGVQGRPFILGAGLPALVAECSSSANGAPDPGELVTMNFTLGNRGEGVTTNLVATLLDGGGVTSAGPPQSYGVLSPIGPQVTRPFALTISSAVACGSDAIATFALSDNGLDLGTVSFNITTGAPVPALATFSNTTPIRIPATGAGATSGAPATPYPSTINVSGVAGSAAGMTLTIRNFSHTQPADVDLLLVNNTFGQKFVVMSDVGGSTDAVNLTMTFADTGSTLPPVLTSGTFRPGNSGASDPFPAPAPPPPYQSPQPGGFATFNSAFGGLSANGTWSLYAVDDTGTDVDTIAGGWSLTFRTTTRACAPVTPPAVTAATVAPQTLWPPNHQMVDVEVTYGSDSNCGTCSLSVTSNEPDNGLGDGDTETDYEIVDAHHVRLRAERSGTGGGRVYSITVTCANGAGTTVQTVPVIVPVDMRAP
jgi:subtilisin-like proprotein convertase family protein